MNNALTDICKCWFHALVFISVNVSRYPVSMEMVVKTAIKTLIDAMDLN